MKPTTYTIRSEHGPLRGVPAYMRGRQNLILLATVFQHGEPMSLLADTRYAGPYLLPECETRKAPRQ